MCINASFTCSHFARQISATRLVHCIAGQLPPMQCIPPNAHFGISTFAKLLLHIYTLLHIVNVMGICNGLWCCITISATLGVSVIALGFGGAPNLTLDRHLLPTLLLPPGHTTTENSIRWLWGERDTQMQKHTNTRIHKLGPKIL